ncbi:19844_t:CDS:2 [Funneliformis geosporum]|nr:19844_t:CDS:2 [Funneliformis geosporum]
MMDRVIKLSGFGSSKRIEAETEQQSCVYGVIPYVDPKFLYRQRNDNTSPQQNEKSDVYSVGVLFWEISSGRQPFYVEGEQYDIDLAIDISEGLREKAVPGTPENYVKIYTECWDNEPDNRPSMNQVVDKLNSIIANLNKTKDEKMNIDDEASLQSSQSSAQHIYSNSLTANFSYTTQLSTTQLSQLIQNFNLVQTNISDNESVNESDNESVNKSDNESDKESDNEPDNEFNKLNNLAKRYQYGWEVEKDLEKAFKYYQMSANQNNSDGQYNLAECYRNGLGIEKDLKKAMYWYQISAECDNKIAQYNLADYYYYGDFHSKNIVIHNKIAKITDFGFSKIENNSTIHIGVCGRAAYIEPQILANPKFQYIKASDIYSYGVLMWEISSGYSPFNNNPNIIAIASGKSHIKEEKEEGFAEDFPNSKRRFCRFK